MNDLFNTLISVVSTIGKMFIFILGLLLFGFLVAGIPALLGPEPPPIRRNKKRPRV